MNISWIAVSSTALATEGQRGVGRIPIEWNARNVRGTAVDPIDL
jgi:hypothetical protein